MREHLRSTSSENRHPTTRFHSISNPESHHNQDICLSQNGDSWSLHDENDPDMGYQPRSSIAGKQPLRLLIVEENVQVRDALCEVAASLGFLIDEADIADAAHQILARKQTDILLLDVTRPESGGQSLLEEMKARHPDTVFIVMTACATIASAVETMRLGACDYLSKPFPFHVLAQSLERAATRWHFGVERRQLQGMSSLLGRSLEMEKLYRFLSTVADSKHPVMIVGESGTGKPLVAKSIHSNSAGAAKPFVSLDCRIFGPALLEAELFGCVKGAVDEVTTEQRGLLASLEGGTLFLNEIGDMPLDLQGKLMRALKDKEIRPIGGTSAIPISVRLLAATNRDLIEMVRGGQFRMDLYQLLSVVNLRIPPLRGRPDDIAFLAKRFLERIQHQTGIPRTLSQETLRMLETYDWPDNVRELEQSIARACSESSGPELQAIHLPQNLLNFYRNRQWVTTQNLVPESTGNMIPTKESIASIAQMEERAILDAIRHTNGDKLRAATLLGIGKTTLYRKLKDYSRVNATKTTAPSVSREFIA